MTAEPRFAIQLYSVRSLDEPLADIIHRVAEAGFQGVEFAHRFREESPTAVAAALEATGLEPIGVHAELPLLEAALDGDSDLLERCAEIGCDTVIVPHLSASRFRTQETVDSMVAQLRNVAATLDEQDIRLGVHNARHYLWPLLPAVADPLLTRTPVPSRFGQYAGTIASRLQRVSQIPDNNGLWHLFDQTDPGELFFELEVAEVRATGFDPVESIQSFADRIGMIHLRDVARTGRFGAYENVPHCDGLVEMQAVVDAARDVGIPWIIYENEFETGPESKITDGAALLERLLSTTGDADSE
jgi:sugar phosphate isomerase/epimerase